MRNLQLFQLTRTGNKAEIPANATLPQLLYRLPCSKHSKLQNIAQQEPLNLTKIARWFSLFYFKVTRCALDEVEFCSFTWKFDEDRSSKWQASKPTSQNANNLTSQRANKLRYFLVKRMFEVDHVMSHVMSQSKKTCDTANDISTTNFSLPPSLAVGVMSEFFIRVVVIRLLCFTD